MGCGIGLRARSPEALERRVAALKGIGLAEDWLDRWRTWDIWAWRSRFTIPDGHLVEIYYETE